MTRNTVGLGFANYTAPNTVRKASFTGTDLGQSPVAFGGIRDLDSLGGFTYVLDISATG